MRNLALGARTTADIDGQVVKILRGLGNPEPPLDLAVVRELLKLDFNYYSTTDDGLLREVTSRLIVMGKQIIKRPTIVGDAVRTLSLKALYLPDQKRIMLDKDLPFLKHRWNEAHEIGHGIIPWHEGMMFGDNEQSLTPACHEKMEAEANYAAGQLLFLAERFRAEAVENTPSLKFVKQMSKQFGNTITSTLWRLVEHGNGGRAMVALVSGHPHPAMRKPDFDPAQPCRYCVESDEFRAKFSISETALFQAIAAYCRPSQGGTIGQDEIILADRNGDRHHFLFETFFNRHEALTLGYWTMPVSA